MTSATAPRAGRGFAALVVVAMVAVGAAGCAAAPSPAASVVRVPEDVATIRGAIDAVADGGLVLIGPGTYTETVEIDKPDVTLRGSDRNAVVIDGEGLRSNGIEVIADGVRVQNLTVRNHTFNGVLVTGLHDENGPQAHNTDGYTTLDPQKSPPLQRFEVSHVTASNNGLYGIYAFNSQHGVISDNYSSGSADSGFYVGQCARCDILVTGNVAENNAIGYENANASDSVVVVGNRFAGNRVGLTLLSWYQEAYLPQASATVVGNVISDNNSATSPSQALGAFGIGVGLSGTKTDVLERNRIEGNTVSGVQISNTEDIAAEGNTLDGNLFAANGVDVADVSAERALSKNTCITGSDDVSAIPASLLLSCGRASTEAATPADLPTPEVPAGMSFLRVPEGPDQPQLPGDLSASPTEPLPAQIAMPDLRALAVPDRALLADRSLAP
jgi:nitrous oxidase accessory protein NosD